MANRHNISIFGKSTGMILDSAELSQPFIFIRMIRKKSDNSWEKPSKQEGKAIKLGLHELCSINQVLQRRKQDQQLYHNFKGNETRIVFAWDSNKREHINITVGDYFKPVHDGHLEVLIRLVDHIIDEKIKYATVRQKRENTDNSKNQ